MIRYLLDTNHLSEALRRVSTVRDRIQQRHRQGDVFATCGPVLCELMVGIVQRKDADAMHRRLDRLLKIVRVWPVDLTLALPYAEAYHELKQAGAALSQVDLMLAAFCGRSGPTLLTADKDFEAIRGISTENWLKSPT